MEDGGDWIDLEDENEGKQVAEHSNISSLPTVTGSVSDPEQDPNSGAFGIRIRRIRIQGLKKRSKMLNQHKIILLLTTLYLSIHFFW